MVGIEVEVAVEVEVDRADGGVNTAVDVIVVICGVAGEYDEKGKTTLE